MINLSIITVSYHSEKFIEKYLNALLHFAPADCEIIIVDSGSKDNTVKKIKQYLSKSPKRNKVKLIESKENIGFGRGNNLAVKRSKGRYLFFLNPDTELKSSLNVLTSFYQHTKDAGVVAPKLVMGDGRVQPSVKNLPTVRGAFKEYVLGIKHSYSEYTPVTDQVLEVESVYGAAMLVSREVFNRVHGFNEKFFLYYEDVDFCKRVRKLGKKIYYHPGVEIMHLVGAAKGDEDRYQLNQKAARIYHGFFGMWFLKTIFLVPRLRRRLNLR